MSSRKAWSFTDPAAHCGTAVWHVDLDKVSINDPGWLSPGESRRGARFLRREDRERFIRSHLALRRILAGTLGCHPAALRFRSEAGGRPELEGPDGERLRFNLSHSGDHALVGISRSAAIGVDIEVIRPLGDAMRIAAAHFHPGEIADLVNTPDADRTTAFFACWTRKEAVVKALGDGLSLPLDRFRVSVPPAKIAVLESERIPARPSEWSMHHLDLGAEAVGAVAIPRADEDCALFRLPPNWNDLG